MIFAHTVTKSLPYTFGPMNVPIVLAWAERLESGNYPQGKRALHRVTPTGDEFCPLGILCEMAVEAGIIEPGSQSRWSGDNVMYDKSTSVLPLSVAKWAGISTNPEYGGASLAYQNDNGKSLPAIAIMVRAMANA